MFFSIFEQFSLNFLGNQISTLLWYLISPILDYFFDETITFAEYICWVNLIVEYYYIAEGNNFVICILPFLGLLVDIYVDISFFDIFCISVLFLEFDYDVVLFVDESVFQKIILHVVLFFEYLFSNWFFSLLVIGLFFFWIIFLLPISIIGKKRVLFSFCTKICVYVYTFFYELVYSYLKDDTKYFFPFIFYIFLFISFFNLCGMIPYSFALTSHLVVTCSIAVISWGGFVLCGLERHGLKLFSIFYPNGLSFYLVPFVCVIEVLSHIIRVISLALRLFSNIVAGHILLDLISIFLFKLTFSSVLGLKIIFFLCGGIVIVALFFFECAICLLQGYIFAVLSCIYCRDYLHLIH